MKKANPTAIGLFLIVGLALGVAGVIVFNSQALFHPKSKRILYFNGSLKGLGVGAPVEFRGVPVGTVDQILLHHNQAGDDFAMPVIIDIDKKLVQSKSDERLQFGNKEFLNSLIQEGFRASLDSDSLVTGVLYISLEIVPNPPPPVFHQLKHEYIEIPTIPSDMQRLMASLGRVDLPGISAKANALLARLNTSVSQLNVTQLNSNLNNVLESANHFVATPDLTNAVIAAKQTLDRAQALLKRLDGRVDPLADNLTKTLLDAQKDLADLRQGIQNFSGMIGSDSALRTDLTQTLEELGNASRAVSDLAEFLQRNPNSLIIGRKQQEP